MNNNTNQNEQTTMTMFSDYPDVVSVEQVTERLKHAKSVADT